MKKCFIIYHKEDNDGVFSAAIAAEYIKSKFPDAEVDHLGADYVMLSKFDVSDFYLWDEAYDTVVMTDISISNPEMMKKMCAILRNKLIWIDHHAPAIKASSQYVDVPGQRDTTRSAILLAWKFFFDPLDESYSAGNAPYILRILSAWDSFTFDREGIDKDFAHDVNVGVTDYFRLSLTSARAFIKGIIEDGGSAADVTYFAENGHTINKHDAWVMANTLQNFGDFNWTVNGRPAVALFLQGATSSLIFKSVQDRVKNGLIFKRKPDGNWVVSIYNANSDDTFHCGEYVKEKYGGGGHVGAAGCTLSEEQFMNILKAKVF